MSGSYVSELLKGLQVHQQPSVVGVGVREKGFSISVKAGEAH